MTTENRNEKTSTSIFDIYEHLGVSNVSENLIVIDHSQKRVENAKLYFSLLVGLPFLIALLSYNVQDSIAFICTLFFTIGIFIYLKYKNSIWYKKISFDNSKGTISYERHFPQKKRLFRYEAMYISSKTHTIKNYSTQYYYLVRKRSVIEKEIKHSLFTGYIYAADEDKEFFIKHLKEFMEQGTLSQELEPYNKDAQN